MGVPIKLILKEIGSRINNIGTIVDTDETNDETTSYAGKMLNGVGSFAGGFKDLKDTADTASDAKDMADAASAASNAASAASDKNVKDVANTEDTSSIIEKAYKQLDDIIYKYNQKGQALGNDDQLRAGVTAQSMQGSILESNVFKDPESGFLKVDTAQLALSNAAAIKQIFERLDKLEGK